MRKRGLSILPILFAVFLLFVSVPDVTVYATEEQETAGDVEGGENGQQDTEETEPVIPESYYLPIESNSIEGWPSGPQVEAEAAAVMDVSTGTFLYSKNMEEKEYPASITKIMTALVAIENGDLDKKIKFSTDAVYGIEAESSHIGLRPGEKLTLRQALYGLMLESGNDAANGIAENIGGSISDFVQMMNDKAAELGCVNTHFTNAHGLHNEDHYTCARDMALITQAAVKNETLKEIMGTVEYEIPKTNKVKEVRYFLNHQKMLYDSKNGFKYEGCLGGKTGYTEQALNTLVTVAERDETLLICVVLRTNGSGKTFTESAQLLDYGFDNFKHTELMLTDSEQTREGLMGVYYLGKVSVFEPEILKEPLVITKDTVNVMIPADPDNQNISRTLAADGTLTYTYGGTPVGSTHLEFNPAAFDPLEPLWKTSMKLKEESETIQQQDALANPEVKEDILKQGIEYVQTAWKRINDWIYENDLMAAAIGLILIIFLFPILVIAYIRNRSSQKIRKKRRKEREEKVMIEKAIESKSVSEIEKELRAELEKDRLRIEQENMQPQIENNQNATPETGNEKEKED